MMNTIITLIPISGISGFAGLNYLKVSRKQIIT